MCPLGFPRQAGAPGQTKVSLTGGGGGAGESLGIGDGLNVTITGVASSGLTGGSASTGEGDGDRDCTGGDGGSGGGGGFGCPNGQRGRGGCVGLKIGSSPQVPPGLCVGWGDGDGEGWGCGRGAAVLGGRGDGCGLTGDIGVRPGGPWGLCQVSGGTGEGEAAGAGSSAAVGAVVTFTLLGGAGGLRMGGGGGGDGAAGLCIVGEGEGLAAGGCGCSSCCTAGCTSTGRPKSSVREGARICGDMSLMAEASSARCDGSAGAGTENSVVSTAGVAAGAACNMLRVLAWPSPAPISSRRALLRVGGGFATASGFGGAAAGPEPPLALPPGMLTGWPSQARLPTLTSVADMLSARA